MANKLKIFFDDEIDNKEALDRLASFALSLHQFDTILTDDLYELLIERELITAENRRRYDKIEQNLIQASYIEKFEIGRDVVHKFDIDHFKEVEDSDPSAEIDTVVQVVTKKIRSDIKRSEWHIKDKLNLPDDFVAWIDSINTGWQNKLRYEKFELYKEQAQHWINENYSFNESWTNEQKLDFVIAERQRCLANGLYVIRKYGYIADPFSAAGEIKFTPYEVQCFLLYLFDCELSAMIGKPRQVGATTLLALVAMVRVSISKNFFVKLVAQKGKKSEEIFQDKVKYPISKFPHYMKPTVGNWNDLEVIFQYKEGKGGSVSSRSKFEVAAPASDVVSAGTPNVVLLDEIGLNDLLGDIITDGRPTIFWYNPATGKLEMRRQMFAWGTSDTVSPVFESEFKSCLEAWKARDFRYGIIPVFINAYAKPGFTNELYESEKAVAYRKKKQVGKKDPRISFHQTYPIVIDDMFLVADDTVIPTMTVVKQIERVTKKTMVKKQVRGYFEPIFDTSIPTPNSHLPFKLIDCRFVPATQDQIDEEDSPFACITIIDRPQNWVNRYWGGVDPVYTASGHSKMGGAIFDGVTKRIVATHNNKAKDYRVNYLQCQCLMMHYGARKKVLRPAKQLIESNVGGEYINYCKDMGYSPYMVNNAELSDNLQTSSVDIGIRRMTNTAKVMINKLEGLLLNCADNIDSEDFWVQVRTYVKVITKTGITYKPKDIRLHYDDLLDAIVYAFINYESHIHLKPMSVEMEQDKKKKRGGSGMKYVYDSNYNLILKKVA